VEDGVHAMDGCHPTCGAGNRHCHTRAKHRKRFVTQTGQSGRERCAYARITLSTAWSDARKWNASLSITPARYPKDDSFSYSDKLLY